MRNCHRNPRRWSLQARHHITFTSAVLLMPQIYGSSIPWRFLLWIIVPVFRDTGRQPAQEHLDFLPIFPLPSCETVRLLPCWGRHRQEKQSRVPHAFRRNFGSNLNAWMCYILAASMHRWNAAKCALFRGGWAGILGCSDALYKHFYLILPLNEIRFLTLTLACSNLSVSN